MSVSDAEIKDVLIWERNWFRRASMGELARREEEAVTTAGIASSVLARRLLRHAVWYLRARRRDANDFKAVHLLLQCLTLILRDRKQFRNDYRERLKVQPLR